MEKSNAGKRRTTWSNLRLPGKQKSCGNVPAAVWTPSGRTLLEQASRMPGYSPRRFRTAFVQQVRQTEPSIWVTLSYNSKMDVIRCHEQIDKFVRALIRKAHHESDLSNVPKGAVPKITGFLEHRNTNAHYNLLINCDEAFHLTLLNHGSSLWRKFVSHASCHVENIRGEDDVISYCIKEQVTLAHFASAYYFAAY